MANLEDDLDREIKNIVGNVYRGNNDGMKYVVISSSVRFLDFFHAVFDIGGYDLTSWKYGVLNLEKSSSLERVTDLRELNAVEAKNLAYYEMEHPEFRVSCGEEVGRIFSGDDGSVSFV
ncbi:MAG: hypothetical protein Q8P81_02000 [Nanoarchaeota archaeon]|nr:hypothetical protein [Nanoarchaeota archaeon]